MGPVFAVSVKWKVGFAFWNRSTVPPPSLTCIASMKASVRARRGVSMKRRVVTVAVKGWPSLTSSTAVRAKLSRMLASSRASSRPCAVPPSCSAKSALTAWLCWKALAKKAWSLAAYLDLCVRGRQPDEQVLHLVGRASGRERLVESGVRRRRPGDVELARAGKGEPQQQKRRNGSAHRSGDRSGHPASRGSERLLCAADPNTAPLVNKRAVSSPVAATRRRRRCHRHGPSGLPSPFPRTHVGRWRVHRL